MRIYVAGPMRGIANFNFPAFFDAGDTLEAHGHSVYNPAKADNDHFGYDISINNPTGDEATLPGFTLREALLRDMTYIGKEADAILMLPGWENSIGAQAEWSFARAIRITIYYSIADIPDPEEVDDDGGSGPVLVLAKYNPDYKPLFETMVLG